MALLASATMNITGLVIVNAALDMAVLAGIGYAMSHARRLRPHKRRHTEALPSWATA